ncbi:MAG TPA: amidohydrolase family protein [Verrucomicrobiae bacterium]|nr:amidohydrolase family protein [Verrucomicrobiae bacterium]
MIDATGAAPQPDVTVVITGDRITAMGRSVDVRSPENAQIVDATGKFLIPGLWDMHVHWEDKDYLPLFIANGVTGIRIIWGMPVHHEWRKEIEQGSLVGPRMLIASAIVDGPNPVWPDSDKAANAAEGRQAVTNARQDGADFVKVYSRLPREAYFAIADEAKKQGIPFEGHVPDSISVEEASKAGQKSIEHLTGVLAACSTPAKTEAMLAEFKKNHTWQCPTFTVLRSMMTSDPAQTNPRLLKYISPALVGYWAAQDKLGTVATITRSLIGEGYFQKHLDMVGAMQRAGVPILAGTDTENPYCFPGFSLHDELGLLVRAGLTPMEALQSATINPARFMGRENELGTIEKGKLADLVLLDANPLDNIANTRKIAAVVARGRLFPRSSLEAMLAQVEAHARKTGILEDTLLKTINEKGADAAVQQYRELRSTQPDAYSFSEDQLDDLGDELLYAKKTKDAITILKLDAELYPQSFLAYDNLGNAYMKDGDKTPAIEIFEKSLKLNPQNRKVVEKLKQLKSQ